MTETEKRLAEKTGEYRRGQPVWRMTERARQLDAEDPEALDRLIEGGPVDIHDA